MEEELEDKRAFVKELEEKLHKKHHEFENLNQDFLR